MKNIKIENIDFEDVELIHMKQDYHKCYVKMYSVQNGFPSPAEDFEGEKLSLDEKYLSKFESTYFAKAKGISNRPTIRENDILIIRADLTVNDGDLAIVSINNSKFTTKRVDLTNKRLIPDNKDFPEIVLQEGDTVIIMGKVHAYVREDLSK